MCGCSQEKIKDVFVMQLWNVTVFELCKFLKLNATIIYTVLPSSNWGRGSYKVLYFQSTWNIPKCGLSLICILPCIDRIGYDSSRNVKYSSPRIFFSISLHPLAFSHFLYEGKTRKIVKAIYAFILQIKKQKCCGNEIVWPPAVIHEEKMRFKWTF